MRISIICKNCEREFEVIFSRKYKAKFCSKKCKYEYGISQEQKDSIGKRMKGKKLRLGEHHTKETKLKFSNIAKKRTGIKNGNYKTGKFCKDKKYNCIVCGKKIGNRGVTSKCLSCSRKIYQNIRYCKICDKKIYKYNKTGLCGSCGCKKRDNSRQKGKSNPMFGRVVKPYWIKYKGTHFRSNWEMWFSQFLNLSKIKWLYESKTFDLGNTTYTPDFYIPKWDLYIEIKGYFSDKAKNKINCFRKKYNKINFTIIDELKFEDIILCS